MHWIFRHYVESNSCIKELLYYHEKKEKTKKEEALTHSFPIDIIMHISGPDSGMAGGKGAYEMELKSLNCPNCSGTIKQDAEGRFYCENCGTTFIPDYDKEDVEYEKLKSEELRRADQDRGAKQRSKVKTIIIVAAVVFGAAITIPTIIFTLMSQKAAMEQSIADRREQALRTKEKKAAEEQKKQQEEKEKAEAEEAARQALLASYQVTPEDLLGDAFFVKNANASMLKQLENNTILYYTNVVWNEQPEYVTSYLLHAKDENNQTQNMVLNIYKVHWDKEFDDHTDHYLMYDGAFLKNVSKDSDGSIKSDFDAHRMTFNSEIHGNQMFSGYSDYDQLIREEIYGNSDYTYTEFKMTEQ